MASLYSGKDHIMVTDLTFLRHSHTMDAYAWD